MDRFEELAHGAHELRVKLERGDIELRAGEELAWTLEWSSERDEEPLVEREGHALTIRQRNSHRMDIRLTMPLGSETVDLRTGSGRIAADGVQGRLRMATGNGPVRLRAGRGDAEVNSGNGAIEVEGYDGSIRLASGNGHTRLERFSGEAKLHTGNGRVEVTQAEGRVHAATGNGDVVLTAVAGEAEIGSGHGAIEVSDARALALRGETGMGAVRLHGGSLRALRLNTMVGDVSCAAELLPGIHELSTVMGTVTLELPSDANARIDAQTSFGQIHSDFPLVRVGRTGPMGFGGVRMVGSIGEGEAQADVALRTNKGSLHLRRRGGGGASAERRYTPDEQPTAPAPQRGAARYESTLAVLEALSRGEITPAEADDLLASSRYS